jgi:hypothetical protein
MMAFKDSLLFGNYIGTGIAIEGHYLYASSNNAIFRYKLDDNYIPVSTNNPERIVIRYIDRGQHALNLLRWIKKIHLCQHWGPF